MSTSPEPIGDEIDTQMVDSYDDSHTEEATTMAETTGDSEVTKAPPKKREKKVASSLEREVGRSLFPISKVQKIIKLDKEIPIVAKDATFAIALATELFIQQLCEAGHAAAHGEKRSTVQPKDIRTVVKRSDEFMFLEDTLPWLFDAPLPKKGLPVNAHPVKEKDATVPVKEKSGPMDSFFGNKGDDDDGVIMNEDGTMFAAGNDDENVFE